jgi:hypothetical protein
MDVDMRSSTPAWGIFPNPAEEASTLATMIMCNPIQLNGLRHFGSSRTDSKLHSPEMQMELARVSAESANHLGNRTSMYRSIGY